MGFFVHINIKLLFQNMLVLMFMFNTNVIYFYVNHYNISSNDT